MGKDGRVRMYRASLLRICMGQGSIDSVYDGTTREASTRIPTSHHGWKGGSACWSKEPWELSLFDVNIHQGPYTCPTSIRYPSTLWSTSRQATWVEAVSVSIIHSRRVWKRLTSIHRIRRLLNGFFLFRLGRFGPLVVYKPGVAVQMGLNMSFTCNAFQAPGSQATGLAQSRDSSTPRRRSGIAAGGETLPSCLRSRTVVAARSRRVV